MSKSFLRLKTIKRMGLIILVVVGASLTCLQIFKPKGNRGKVDEIRGTAISLKASLEEHLSIHQALPLSERHTEDAIILTNGPEGSSFLSSLSEVSDQNYPNSLLDPWGSPYRILLDYDRDFTLQIPNTSITREGAAYLIWSCGPDGKTGTSKTSKDDLFYWQ